MENEISGVILINKHAGVTSHDIVFKIRKLFQTKKVGHTGTLDPLATGILPVLVGRSAKAAEYLLSEDKKYIAELKLGITTDTEDITGNVLTRTEKLPSKEQFFEACKKMVGSIKQIPPMYSALKVNGKKLVDLAREGITIERQPRDITVFENIPEEVDEKQGLYRLNVHCSKGTYIRTLCSDIGSLLGCGATMTSLERISTGSFDIKDSYKIAELEEMSYEERVEKLIPTESLFSELSSVKLEGFYLKLFKSGCEIYQNKIKTSYPVDEFLKIYDSEGFLALAQVKEYEQGSAIKSIKFFRI